MAFRLLALNAEAIKRFCQLFAFVCPLLRSPRFLPRGFCLLRGFRFKNCANLLQGFAEVCVALMPTLVHFFFLTKHNGLVEELQNPTGDVLDFSRPRDPLRAWNEAIQGHYVASIVVNMAGNRQGQGAPSLGLAVRDACRGVQPKLQC